MQLQRENGKFYVSMVKNEDPSIITALTVCDDLQALEDLMTAFILVGHIRNQSNHALPYGGESDSPFPGEHDSSKLFTDISECISYFSEPSPPDPKNQMELPKLVCFGLPDS